MAFIEGTWWWELSNGRALVLISDVIGVVYNNPNVNIHMANGQVIPVYAGGEPAAYGVVIREIKEAIKTRAEIKSWSEVQTPERSNLWARIKQALSRKPSLDSLQQQNG